MSKLRAWSGREVFDFTIPEVPSDVRKIKGFGCGALSKITISNFNMILRIKYGVKMSKVKKKEVFKFEKTLISGMFELAKFNRS